MNHRKYCGVSATLFTFVALAHLTRLINGWSVEIVAVNVPMSVSWVGIVVTASLAAWGFSQIRGNRN